MALTPPPVAPPAAPPLPGEAPSRANPSTFRELADAFVVWQVGFRDWLAGLITWLAGYISWASTNVAEMDALQTDVQGKSDTATTAATAAVASAAAVQANRTALDNRLYPGTYAADPATRPDGSAVQAGDRYFNSSIARQKTYSGTVWATDNLDAAAIAAASGASLMGVEQPDAGAVPLTVESFLRGLFVTPGQFGAVGGGVVDDSAAVQKALATGKHVYLAGLATYYCASTITMAVAGTVLFGPGTLKFNAAAPVTSTLLSITADRCTVDGITVDMQSANTARAITPINTDGTTIRNVRHLNGGQFFVRASGTVRNLAVIGCKSPTVGYGVLIQDPSANSYGFIAHGNVFEHPATGQGDGIEVNAPTNGFSDVSIYGNRVNGCFGVALVAGIGIGVANVQRFKVYGNTVTNCEGDGIHAEDRSQGEIFGNDVVACATSLTTTTGGISVSNACPSVKVYGNNVDGTGSQRPGIATFGSAGKLSTDITITNNAIANTPKEGMSLDSITGGMVAGNTITNPNTTNTASTGAIRFPGFSNVTSRVQVRGNTVRQGANPVRSVIFATPGRASQCVVADNDFIGCTTPSIDDGSNAVDRYGNRMSTDSMYGTFTLAASTNTTVANGNTNTAQNILIIPTNAAARALGIPFMSSVISGTSFTVQHAVAAGTETYSYRIL